MFNIIETEIGLIPEHWQIISFEGLIETGSLSYGIVQPGNHQEQNSVPIIRVNNIKSGRIHAEDVMKVGIEIEKKYKRTRLKGGELLLTVVGSLGEAVIVPNEFENWNIARAVSVSKISDNYNKYFIKYCFSTDQIKHQIYGHSNDTAQPTLNLSSLKEIKFPIPPLPEQNQITSALSSLDNKIDLLQRQIKTLEQLAETLFRQWFLEEANESWEVTTFASIIHQVKGRVNDLSVRSEELKVLSAVKTGELVLSEDYFKKQVFSKDIGKYIIVKQYDFAYNPSRINIGSIGMLGENITGAVSPVYVVFRPKTNWYYYIQFMLKQQYVKSTIEIYASGSVRQSLDYDSFSKIEITLPPFEKVEMFNSYYSETLNKINANKNQIRTLTQLRDTLLPKLMSGEVRVESN